jgi:hypothetical protein
MTHDEEQRIRDDQKVKDSIGYIHTKMKNNSKLLWTLITVNGALLIALLGWLFIYVSSQNANVTTTTYILKELDKKAARSKLNISAQWCYMMDSNHKERAQSMYYIVTEPSDVTRGGKIQHD